MLFNVLAVCAMLVTSCASPSTPATTIVSTVIVAGTPMVVTATPEATKNPYDSNAPIKLMIDGARQPVVDAFLKKYPEYKDKIEVMSDSMGVFLDKLLLWNNVGSGWPDVLFNEVNVIRLANSKQYDYYDADLTQWVSKDILNQFYPGSMAPCTGPDGKIICIRNDVAPNLFYYNVPLFKKWGYTVPATWEEFLSLAQKVAKDHPGTVMAELDSFRPDMQYYVGAECPMMDPLSPTSFRVNFLHPNCQRMSKMLDDLNALGVMDKSGTFSAGLVDKWQQNEWLTFIGPNWLADFVIKGLYLDPAKTEPGIVGIAPMLKFADQTQIWTGSSGGGGWVMSRYTKNPELAMKFIMFAATDPDVTLNGPTQAAFQPGGDAWAQALGPRSPLIAKDPDPYPTLKLMAGSIWPDWLEGPPIVGNVMYPFFTDVMAGKRTVVDCANDIQKGLVDLVQKLGYEVITTGP
jgi:multiple sugar transport system substrate-binding protein